MLKKVFELVDATLAVEVTDEFKRISVVDPYNLRDIKQILNWNSQNEIKSDHFNMLKIYLNASVTGYGFNIAGLRIKVQKALSRGADICVIFVSFVKPI